MILKTNNQQTTTTNQQLTNNQQTKEPRTTHSLSTNTYLGALSEAIGASGDTLQDKGEGNVRFIFQNTNGISLRKGLSVIPEIATIVALHLDVTGFTETNIHWNQESRGKVTQQLYSHLGDSRLI